MTLARRGHRACCHGISLYGLQWACEDSPGEAATDTVLIVDDDAGQRASLARLMRVAGLDVRSFGSADEFLSAHAASQFDSGCVVLDVRMPGMGGPELHRAMLERKITLPVVFLTGYGDVPTSVDAMKMGAVDFLEKPVRSEALLATVRSALARQAAVRDHAREVREIEARIARLTPREHEVMDHVVRGRLNKQIAYDLGISLKTVKVHRAKVMDKMEARSVAMLVELCHEARGA
jgi:FixJ family two-component response regulator